MEILVFFIGTVFFYTASFYALLALVALIFLTQKFRYLFYFSGAVLLTFIHSKYTDSGYLPKDALKRATLTGTVVSLPKRDAHKIQFQFDVDTVNNQPLAMKIILSCYQHCPNIQYSQQWRLRVTLKKIENLGNPGAFNYRNTMLAQHIQWGGYILPASAQLLQKGKHGSLLAIRQALANRITKKITGPEEQAIVQALTVGLVSGLSTQQWQLFRNTGTIHLMVICGAHIGLVAGIVFIVLRRLWMLSETLCLFRPASYFASILSILFAAMYALLAGFAVPAQRALVACFFLGSRQFLGRYYSNWQAWRYALFMVLVTEPHAVLLTGFYLSFLAVAIILAASKLFDTTTLKQLLCIQFSCFIGLLPFTLYWFSYGSINGLIANIVAVPVVGWVIVPLALLSMIGTLFPLPAEFFYPIACVCKMFLLFLRWVDGFSFINITFNIASIIQVLSLTLATLLFVFFPAKPLRCASIILIIGALLYSPMTVKKSQALITILDVGQGLAVAVHTQKHTVLFDTGMQFSQGHDMGKLAIIPYLKNQGIHKIDSIIISHPDMDHRGGLHTLEQQYKAVPLIVNNPQFYHRGLNCHTQKPWVWDGVIFEFLPVLLAAEDKNNNSCVLKITAQGSSILLTGDIEKKAENYLLSHVASKLSSNFLVVAHHGSKTSSTQRFIQAVHPQYAIISAGFDNRFHFPHNTVLQTFASWKIPVFNTANCGMVSVTLAPTISQPRCFQKIER